MVVRKLIMYDLFSHVDLCENQHISCILYLKSQCEISYKCIAYECSVLLSSEQYGVRST